MKVLAALTVTVAVLGAQSERVPQHSVTAVRHWALTDATRIAIEVSGEFKFHWDRLHSPERVYFDILNARPRIDGRRFFSQEYHDPLVEKVRVAETVPGTTRIVLDLSGPVEVSTSQLSNPYRLMVELRHAAGPAIPTEPPAASQPAATPKPEPPPLKMQLPANPAKQPSGVNGLAADQTVQAPATASKTQVAAVVRPAAESPGFAADIPEPVTDVTKTTAKVSKPASDVSRSPAEVSRSTAGISRPLPNSSKPAAANSTDVADVSKPAITEKTTAASGASQPTTPQADMEVGKAARHFSNGQTSLVRALGLKLNRVVIDPGHGGHDEGTHGVHGLLEKDVVLDVALRLGKLIEERMGAEVIYTRTDDTFVPLEGRTQLANDKKADLFLSIHANSSPVPRIAGVETYYLNFTESKDALDVAARENATSQQSVYDLRDIIQKITLHDKAEESRDFAGKIQAALYGLSVHSFPSEKNRGVKKAPFVVLIGANMPSVLAEIGFLSNTREEALLRKPEYREKIAEALYRGISRYAESLSHFQMAESQ